jgi:hypothetical protein
MRKLDFLNTILLALLFSCAPEAEAQNRIALISLSNFDSDQPIFFSPGPGLTQRAPVNGTFVQILGGPRADSLVVLNTQLGEIFGLVEPGFFDAMSFVMTNAQPRSTAWFQIRSWRGDATWDRAVINPRAFAGQSPVFENPTGVFEGFNTAIPSLFLNAPSFTIMPVPEPSTPLLILFGLLLMRRSKAKRVRFV